MSEKYTIVESLSSENNGACWLFKGDVKIASFNFLVEAELVCRLLNEEEKRKSLPKIDKHYKDLFLTTLNKKLNFLKTGDVGRLKASDYYSEEIIAIENSIKAIESLECE